MKAYSNKSNARRAGKELCKLHDNLGLAEPLFYEGEGWYPAVFVEIGTAADDVKKTAKVVDRPQPIATSENPTVQAAEDFKDEDEPDTEGLGIETSENSTEQAVKDFEGEDEPDTEGLGEPTPEPQPQPAPKGKGKDKGKGKTKPKPAAKPKKGDKQTKSARAIALMSRPDGVTAPDLMKQLDWQAHTLRGWVSLQNSKEHRGIITKRVDGVTSYMIKAK